MSYVYPLKLQIEVRTVSFCEMHFRLKDRADPNNFIVEYNKRLLV